VLKLEYAVVSCGFFFSETFMFKTWVSLHLSRYLTMDQTRKLLLVLDSDPKATMLPLVGV